MIFAQLRRLLLGGGFFLLVACSAWAQTTTLEGQVKGPDGQPYKGAVITLTRTDIKGHYTVKSDKKGHWLYTGLPYGTYDITCSINGQVVDKVNGVHSKYGESVTVDFNAAKMQQQQAANASGQLTEEQSRGMSKEQKEQYEEQLKKNAEAIKKNKALNDTYNAGQTSLKAAQADTDPTKKAADFNAAIDSLNKAAQIDANQVAIWNSLGEAYTGLAATQTGDAKTKSYDQAVDAYKKSLALKPNDPQFEAAIYNQLGNIYGAEKKMPEATDALTKAAQLNPAMAAKAYFNMGANMVNSGHPADAAEFFKKATDADPDYADAWYQYGSLLMMKGSVDPKTGQQTYPPDTATALKKYLELQPNGKYAQEASAMLQAMGEKVQTNIKVPTGKKK